ncbi:Branched-chain amino acid transport system / permease component [Anaerovirgula multivorans]|uniref:Branched-chain amino acid transport system / permease component n=2 Tax=Anaerovirgula multivorans TaxID=312168 RepID=A0A239K2G7_9FIRM|nr:Branched-chain amino acid transport system / permease component [Anaerovirgula multivorans]
MKAVGENLVISEKLGIDVDKTRKISIVVSTVLAALAHLMFIQDLGIINV